MFELRPMTADDIEPYRALSGRAFSVLDAQRSAFDPWITPSPEPTAARLRFEHLLKTDAGGSWIAVDGGGKVIGGAVALVREGVWGLSSLAVEPDLQSAGMGRALLAKALEYGGGGERGAIIVASSDSRALRAYTRAGFDLLPAIKAAGPPRRDRAPDPPDWVRPARPADFAAMAATSRSVRGASYAADFPTMYVTSDLHVAADGERGFAWHRLGTLQLLVASDEQAAQALLWAALAGTPEGVNADVSFLTAQQQWAFPVVLDAGLHLTPDGAVMVRGDLGPLAPFKPSGAYL